MLTECLPGSIHFMSPLKEFSLIKDVIKIARSAKQNKLGIYNDKKIEILPIRLKNKKIERYDKSRRETNGKEERSVREQRKTKRLDTTVSYVRKFGQQSQYKLDTARLDQEILKERQEECRMKVKQKGLKGDASMPCLNLFVTETMDRSESRLLPVLQKSKFAV